MLFINVKLSCHELDSTLCFEDVGEHSGIAPYIENCVLLGYYHYSLHSTPAECSSRPLHGRSLKSRIVPYILSLELKEMQVVMNFSVAEKGPNDPLDRQ
jgi:hypothetical protein